jgi:hypothetical protein
MKRHVTPAPLALIIALTVSALGCGYGPDFESGRLRCAAADDSCPEGYYCAGDGRCWRDGEVPGGSRDRFVGDWSFIGPSTRTIQCSDGSGGTEDWAGRDFVPIETGLGSSLEANFFCLWILDLNSAGNSTVIRPGQSCTDVDLSDPTISYTWQGESFTITSTDGRTGTGQMSLPYSYRSPLANGSCTMTYSVTLTKD